MTDIINYCKSSIPCLHRIHYKEKLIYNSPQWIQWKLGFSIDIRYLENKLNFCLKELDGEKYDIESKGKIPITFDDGYKEILMFEKFNKIKEFHEYFQPIMFIPISILKEQKPLLWFDKLYYILSILSGENLQFLWKRYELNISSYYEYKNKELILKLASGGLKNQLLLLNYNKQHKILDKIVEEFEISLNSEKINKELYLNIKDIKFLLKSNWILGSHGLYHHNFNNININELKEELTESLAKILELGGKPFLAFPDGKYNESVVNCALKVGFSHLFTLYSDELFDNDYLFNRIIW